MLVFFLWLVKSLKNLWINVAFFLILSIVLGLLNQLQIFWELYLIELPGLLWDLGLLELVALNISKGFCRAWHAGLHQHNSYGMLVQIFGLVSSLFSNIPVWSSQEYPVNAGIFQGLILGLALFLLYIDLYSKCDQAYNRIDLWSWIWYMRHCWLVFFLPI